MTVTEKIASLRQHMLRAEIDAYIIPSSDPHQSEYLAPHWQVRQWMSGFTGSAGTLVITTTFAGLWTDSRYFLQAEDQLNETEIRLMRLAVPHSPEYIEWLQANLRPNASVGLDGALFAANMVKQIHRALHPKGIVLKPDVDLVSKIWINRPPLPQAPVREHDLRYAGLTRAEKLEDIRAVLAQRDIDYHLLCSLDDIAWTFNLRGSDVAYNPTPIAYALITPHKATLFIDQQKVPAEVQTALRRDNVSIAPYASVAQIISAISDEKSILIDPDKLNYLLRVRLSPKAQVVDGVSIPSVMKAQKNDVEIAQLRHTMIKDGVAMVRFLRWIEGALGNELVTEITAAEKLLSFRQEQEDFQGESFATISAYKEHAALPHYSASFESDVPIKSDSVYLVDSGGQYLGGTTDITRTIALGLPSSEEVLDFTLVLKGHIALADAYFPVGTKGHQIDALARLPLWKAGLNYGHGTGHGVGFFLNVHEGPQSIRPLGNNTPHTGFDRGMVTSNEPGVYKVGRHGIRIENLVLTVSAGQSEFGEFLKFETLTLCPIDTKLIDATLLDSNEKAWLNRYHNLVYERLAPYLNAEEVVWLHHKTKEIS